MFSVARSTNRCRKNCSKRRICRYLPSMRGHRAERLAAATMVAAYRRQRYAVSPRSGSVQIPTSPLQGLEHTGHDGGRAPYKVPGNRKPGHFKSIRCVHPCHSLFGGSPRPRGRIVIADPISAASFAHVEPRGSCSPRWREASRGAPTYRPFLYKGAKPPGVARASQSAPLGRPAGFAAFCSGSTNNIKASISGIYSSSMKT